MNASTTLLLICCCVLYATVLSIPLHHAQILGTHNSYHVASTPALLAWNYSALPLQEQLECFGVRKFEFDVWYREGQFLVYHVNTYDNNSNCESLQECLSVLSKWSTSNPTHFPIIVQVEPKDFDLLTSPQWDEYDTIVKNAIGEANIFTPDDFKNGTYNTVKAARETLGGWPDVDLLRGQFILYIDHSYNAYVTGVNGNLTSRTSFVNCDFANKDDPNCGFITFTNVTSTTDQQNLEQVVGAGFLTRVRADSDFFAGTFTEEDLKVSSFYVLDTDKSNTISITEITDFLLITQNVVLEQLQLLLLNGAVSTTCAPMNLTQYTGCFLTAAQSQLPPDLFNLGSSYEQTKNNSEASLETGAFILDTDYLVPISGKTKEDYYFQILGGDPVRCSPILATDGCDPAMLETGLYNRSCADAAIEAKLTISGDGSDGTGSDGTDGTGSDGGDSTDGSDGGDGTGSDGGDGNDATDGGDGGDGTDGADGTDGGAASSLYGVLFFAF